MPIFVVERVFSSPITEAQFMAGGEALAPCIEARDVKHVGSFLAQDGTRSWCHYEAADAERVREANRTAGAPFERVWPVRKFGG
ncbi:MAG TPA: nickel-binding protein [Kofleriaceae bacterium]|nr:nickel-binding protein [Kofleriaceae bacterium]